MSKLNDYLWFEMNIYKIQKQNKDFCDYVIIKDQKVLGFSNSYVNAINTYGDDVSIFFISSNYPRGVV